MDTQLAGTQDMGRLAAALDMAKSVITKEYLYRLSDLEVVDLPAEVAKLDDMDKYTRIYKFTRMVTDRNESVIDKMVTVLNAAFTSNATVVTLLLGHRERTDYYFGVVSRDIGQQKEPIETQGATVEGVLKGNFPGLETVQVRGGEKRELLKNIFAYDYITSISGIASMRNEKDTSYEKFVQGIEHLVDSLQGREYGVVVIADPVSARELSTARAGYEALYTQLSPFLRMSVSLNESESVTLTQSHTEGVTKTIGESTSLTQNYTKTSGWSEGFSSGESKNKAVGQVIGTLVGAGIGVAATVLTGGAAAAAMAGGGAAAAMAGGGAAAAMAGGGAAAAAAGGSAAAMIGAGAAAGGMGSQIFGGIAGSSGKSTSRSTGESGSIAEASGLNASRNSSTANQKSVSESEATGTSHGKTMQLSNENKTVKNILGMIDKQIERLQKCEAYGAFNCATYVISSDPETNAIVSSGYNALMRGDNSSLQASQINNWHPEKDKRKAEKVKGYLQKFAHPMFFDSADRELYLTPASIANSYELSVNIGLPKRSIAGLPVYEMAAFGRNVLEANALGANAGRKDTPRINLGSIYHMGTRQDSVKVDLNLKSLAMHTFVTGSTGSGKSNTVYGLLRGLHKKGVKFLVVEPAKGEYKHVFGNGTADVYGTNPSVSPLLKLNPFKFPQGIHVLEHIDRLIEIFNVCWPMYAAMPAVLKDSVERAYISAGWDLESSRNRVSDRLFPTFADVLNELNAVVRESAFSDEVKDNYIGSLATRIKSLTNGIYGRIFASSELGDERLFDRSVIVDLSRVGSVETKSMIMGILVMRLQEYRMTSGEMNADLKHVTVLEEAHNLLKRTSTEQSGESSNLLGKSVEMLSNAIAEVRTYGEGFIIADQAPGLLDMSVIRNTNTKIIMRLPDAEDRNLVGKAANLSDDQIKELARIPTGVAAVYQNNWLEPVLCAVNHEKTESGYSYKGSQKDDERGRLKIILEKLFAKAAGEAPDKKIDETLNTILSSDIPTGLKIKVIGLLGRTDKIGLGDICSAVYDIVGARYIDEEADRAESVEEWKNTYVHSEKSFIADMDEEHQNLIMECIIREQIKEKDSLDKYLEIWHGYLDARPGQV